MAKGETYKEFVTKFEHKKTTDDCYTPAEVYDTVLDWVRKHCDIEGARVVRPFYPGGDYERYPYEAGDVVIDNPPFSIITRITRHYLERGVRFFLFAPHLTTFSPARGCTAVIAAATVVYANGALVNTSFVSNLFGDIAAMTAPDLRASLEKIARPDAKHPPRYEYPAHVLRAIDLEWLARRGIHFEVRHASTAHVTRLASQGKMAIFGGGLLLSDRAAAGLAEARITAARAAAQAAEPVQRWTLSEAELEIIKNLE